MPDPATQVQSIWVSKCERKRSSRLTAQMVHFQSHPRLDVQSGIEVCNVLRRVRKVGFDPEKYAGKDVHAQRCDHEQPAYLEDGRPQIHDGIVFDNPA